MALKEESNAEKLERTRVDELDRILGSVFKVLDDGFVRVVDYMGTDASIVQAARVSYGTGTKKVHEDRGLIRYLLRHRHTTPFEMCEIKLHVRVPMDCWRQWVRHRMACLSGATQIHFDDPAAEQDGRPSLVKVPIEQVWKRPESVRGLSIHRLNEDSLAIEPARVVDVFRNGVKPLYRVTLDDGKSIECTRDHRFLFADGWNSLGDELDLREVGGVAVWSGAARDLHVNGTVLAPPPGAPPGASARTVARLARIRSIEFVGDGETYDLEVEGPHHNFIANGIVTHNSVNEYSTRYSVAIDAAQRTPAGEWRVQAVGNRQGSEGFLDSGRGNDFTTKEEQLHKLSRDLYEERLQSGIAREQARKDLPLSTYTEAYWKIDLHNLLHFLALRMDDHAQEEIRAYATVIGEEIVAKWCPLTWEAFKDYRFHALQLSRLEVQVIQAIGKGSRDQAVEIARGLGWLDEGPRGLKSNRERQELESKLELLNLPVPWRSSPGEG